MSRELIRPIPLVEELQRIGEFHNVVDILPRLATISKEIPMRKDTFREHVSNHVTHQKMGSYAGYIKYGPKTIAMHPQLYQPGFEQRFRDTLLHECAHMIAKHCFSHNGHGMLWRNTMAALGFENPKSEHYFHFDIDPDNKMNVKYQCLDCGKTYARMRRWPRDNGRWHPECKKANKPFAGAIMLVRHNSYGIELDLETARNPDVRKQIWEMFEPKW